ncbi:autotransporter outer membrane beta-barrel domain-containing protein [Phyllobacterium zundukense]|nr:autotransporter outer membrane beta-barrel domain-containing protein [Phyllobacterium zundukense]
MDDKFYTAKQVRNRHFLAGVSCAALVIACMLSTEVMAGTYTASSRAELDGAITAANADPDPNATIQLTGNIVFAGASSLVVPTKPITIDTQGFTLSGADGSGAAAGTGIALLGSGVGRVYTLVGTFKGGNADLGSGGSGIRITQGASVTNDGVIQGGNSLGGSGGLGLELGGPGGVPSLVNNGTIRGGNGALANGNGIFVRRGTIINTGTIEGGTGASAIVTNSTASLNVINSGTIRAGAGQANAILLTQGGANGITLELQAGSVIDGNVVGNSTVTNDILRLGGTGTDSFDVSTIGPQYQNFDTFQKTGNGTWALTGTGTATTNWDIQAGTLAIGNGGTSGSVLGSLALNGGTLEFNRSDVVTFDNVITGTGNVVQSGSGRTILNGDYTYSGLTSIVAGTLAINGSITTPVSVATAGTLGGIGTIFGDVTNTGKVAPGNSIGTLTVAGNYVGNGGLLEIETELGGDASPTDRLVVTGDTSGSTDVRVINVGGTGAQTVEGIKIIDIGGASNGAFSLLGDYVIGGQQAVVAGAYGYTLQKNGVSTPSDGDWYLRSALTSPTEPGEPGKPGGPLYQPGVPIYEAYAQVLQSLNGVSTLQQRVGNRYWAGAGNGALAQGDGPGTVEAAPLPSEGGDIVTDARGIWARIEGAHGKFEPRTSTSGADYDIDTWELESGIDGQFYESNAGKLIGSLTAHYGHASADISSFFGNGSIDTDGYGLGGTLTWYGQNGFYVDGQAQATWYDSDLTSSTLGTSLADGNNDFGYAFSLETGKRFNLNQNWTLTPQAQLAYSNVDIDSFTDPFGADVSFGSGDSLKGRIGLSADYQNAWEDGAGKLTRTNLYGIANLYYEFLDGNETDVSGVNFATANDRTWGGIGAGGSYNWNDDKYSLYSEVSINTSLSNFADSYSLNGTAGFRVKF